MFSLCGQGEGETKSISPFPWTAVGGKSFLQEKGVGFKYSKPIAFAYVMFREQQLGFFLLFPPPFMSRKQLQQLCCQQQHVRCQFLPISPQVTKWLEKRKSKVEETRWGNNNFQSLWSPLFHLICLDNPPLWVILYARAHMQRLFVILTLRRMQFGPMDIRLICCKHQSPLSSTFTCKCCLLREVLQLEECWNVFSKPFQSLM